MTISILRSKRLWKDEWTVMPKDIVLVMVRNQVSIESDASFDESGMIYWCNQNCNGLFRYTNPIFYFEEESDMLAFKLSWDGKDDEE